MNKKRLLTALLLTAGLVSIGTYLNSTYTYYSLCETEHALEVELLEVKLENARSIIEIQEQVIADMDEELESLYAAPIYNVPLSKELQQYTYDMCNMYGIEDKYEVVLALMWRESNFDPDAVSSTEDYGLMQINAIHLNETFDVVDVMDPKQNIDFGVKTLAGLYESYIDDNMVLMAYNFGCCGAERHWDAGTYASNYSLDILDKVELIRTDQYYN